MIAGRRKQQIPPLRCAPVGMTNYADNFRDKTLGPAFRLTIYDRRSHYVVGAD